MGTARSWAIVAKCLVVWATIFEFPVQRLDWQLCQPCRPTCRSQAEVSEANESLAKQNACNTGYMICERDGSFSCAFHDNAYKQSQRGVHQAIRAEKMMGISAQANAESRYSIRQASNAQIQAADRVVRKVNDVNTWFTISVACCLCQACLIRIS